MRKEVHYVLFKIFYLRFLRKERKYHDFFSLHNKNEFLIPNSSLKENFENFKIFIQKVIAKYVLSSKCLTLK